MEIPHVVVFKLCNIFTFRSLVEELILKHKVDSQTGTKTEKLLFSPWCERFHKIWWKSQEKSRSECERLSSGNDTDAYFCFCTKLVVSVSANTSKLPQQIVLLTNATVILWMSSKRNMNAALKLVVVLLTSQSSLKTKPALNLIPGESFKELPLFFCLMLLRP